MQFYFVPPVSVHVEWFNAKLFRPSNTRSLMLAVSGVPNPCVGFYDNGGGAWRSLGGTSYGADEVYAWAELTVTPAATDFDGEVKSVVTSGYGGTRATHPSPKNVAVPQVHPQQDKNTSDATPITKHEGKKYLRLIYPADGVGGPINVDVYSVLKAFKVTSQPVGHAIKKLLAPGQRGKGSVKDDLKGVLAAVNRAIDQEAEDGPPADNAGG